MRPIMVRMDSTNDKIYIIKNATTKLKDLDKYKGVYINNEISMEERQAQRQMRLDVKALRDQGQQCKIIKGKIVDPDSVEIPPPRPGLLNKHQSPCFHEIYLKNM